MWGLWLTSTPSDNDESHGSFTMNLIILSPSLSTYHTWRGIEGVHFLHTVDASFFGALQQTCCRIAEFRGTRREISNPPLRGVCRTKLRRPIEPLESLQTNVARFFRPLTTIISFSFNHGKIFGVGFCMFSVCLKSGGEETVKAATTTKKQHTQR